MSGLEGPAASLAIAAAKRFVRTTEFDRLCSALADRFGERTGYGAGSFADWSKSHEFMGALGGYLRPPHDFDRVALAYTDEPTPGELDVVTDAGGGPVVFDTGVLHSLALLGATISDMALAEFPLSLTAMSTIEDLIQAATGNLTRRDKPMQQAAWDPQTRDLVFIETPAEDVLAIQQAIQTMQQLATRLHTSREFSSGEATCEDFDESSVVARIYSETTDIARDARCAVYSDDRLFRRLLAQTGTPCFSTLALLQVLRDNGTLDDEAHADAVNQLRVRRATFGS
jgi:hypothetical protein